MGKIVSVGAALVAVVIILIAGAATAVVQAILGTSTSRPSPTALADIPANYLTLYQQAAATCPGLDWTILAAIGKTESDHGRGTGTGIHTGENLAGAGGPMQFLQTTFTTVVARHPLPPGGTTPPSRYNPHDAIYTAATYLCETGARDGQDLHHAIFTYNHSEHYVQDVLAQAKLYANATTTTSPDDCTAIHTPNPAALAASEKSAGVAVAFACAQLGKPYVWGGDGNPGFDCSGLTHAAYAAAGIAIPRTAQTQYNAGPLLPANAPLQPGDLLFFGTPRHIHHVGISLGGILMINAPDFGQAVTVSDRRQLRDYAGASRPTRGDVSPQTEP